MFTKLNFMFYNFFSYVEHLKYNNLLVNTEEFGVDWINMYQIKN